ncbi:hypothetical protein [Pseudomonas duriflava]|nr:hypothetical protein [Pseudomonas duriflava]
MASSEERVYLVVNGQYGDSNLGLVLFLYEPSITTLEACQAARVQGLRDRIWMHYTHRLARERIKGFTVQLNYQCARSSQVLEPWYEKDFYDLVYLIRVDANARLTLRPFENQAACQYALRQLPEPQQAGYRCARSNQYLL